MIMGMSSGKVEDVCTSDLEDTAAWAIYRAHKNYIRLGLPPIENMNSFTDWFYKHVTGITAYE